MSYRKHLRQVQRARRVAKARKQALLALELEGFVAITLHTATHRLTIPIKWETGTQVADTLREALREQRRYLKTEARQLRRDGGENDYRQGTTLAGSAGGTLDRKEALPPTAVLPRPE